MSPKLIELESLNLVCWQAFAGTMATYKNLTARVSGEINSAHFLFWDPLHISVTNGARKFGIFLANLANFRVLHGLAPPYVDQLVRVANVRGRHRLRSSTSQLLLQLHVPASYCPATVDRRSFPAVASIIWNSLPADIQSSASHSFFAND